MDDSEKLVDAFAAAMKELKKKYILIIDHGAGDGEEEDAIFEIRSFRVLTEKESKSVGLPAARIIYKKDDEVQRKLLPGEDI